MQHLTTAIYDTTEFHEFLKERGLPGPDNAPDWAYREFAEEVSRGFWGDLAPDPAPDAHLETAFEDMVSGGEF